MLNSSQIQIDRQLYWVPTVNIASLKNCLQGCNFHPLNADLWRCSWEEGDLWNMFSASTMLGLGEGREMFAFIKSCWKKSRHTDSQKPPWRWLCNDNIHLHPTKEGGFLHWRVGIFSSNKPTKFGPFGQLFQRVHVLTGIWGFGFKASLEWCRLKWNDPCQTALPQILQMIHSPLPMYLASTRMTGNSIISWIQSSGLSFSLVPSKSITQ